MGEWQDEKLQPLPDELNKLREEVLKACKNKRTSPPLNEPFKITVDSVSEKQVMAVFGRARHITIIRNGEITQLPDTAWGPEVINDSPDEWLEYCKAIHDALTEGRVLKKMS